MPGLLSKFDNLRIFYGTQWQHIDAISAGTAIQGLRRDPRIIQLPPYLSLFCIVVGLAWLLVLPLDEYSRHTYISENALLPGQVNTYFGGSEHTVFRAYRHEVAALAESSPAEYGLTRKRNDKLLDEYF